MKARVKATGEIVEVMYSTEMGVGTSNGVYLVQDLEEIESDYWTRLEHQYAGMAMQGMLNNSLLISGLLKVGKSHEDIVDEVTGTAVRYAHALVEMMKEEK